MLEANVSKINSLLDTAMSKEFTLEAKRIQERLVSEYTAKFKEELVAASVRFSFKLTREYDIRNLMNQVQVHLLISEDNND